MRYLDGFVVPVPRKNLKAYRALASKAQKIFMEYGALQYVEAIADDVSVKAATNFPRAVKLKKGEVAVFSWIMFKSRAHRDGINRKIMKDPRLTDMMTAKNMPFDMRRMLYGGFKTLIDK